MGLQRSILISIQILAFFIICAIVPSNASSTPEKAKQNTQTTKMAPAKGMVELKASKDFDYPTCAEWMNGSNAEIQLNADDLLEAWYVDTTVTPNKVTKLGEGTYDNPSAWINITRYVHCGENVIKVKVTNLKEQTGCAGTLTLRFTGRQGFAQWERGNPTHTEYGRICYQEATYFHIKGPPLEKK